MLKKMKFDEEKFERIGTDLSLEECYCEGFTVMEFFKKDEKENKLSKDSGVTFLRFQDLYDDCDYHLSESGLEETTPICQAFWNLEDLWETYNEGNTKEQVAVCCDQEFLVMPESAQEWLALGDAMTCVGWTFDRNEVHYPGY